MKIVALITEYNPLHNGHVYHIDQAKKLTGADYAIAIMSGNYVQRGTPACMDKYLRTESALRSGVDLVLELPLPYATGSAEYFARGAVALADLIGGVDYLCFGSECGSIEHLKTIASLMNHEPEEVSSLIKADMRSGMSYPSARAHAFSQWILREEISDELSEEILTECLTAPNNILGIEYLRALERSHSSIVPVTLKRTSDYLSTTLSSPTASATGIRQVLESSCKNPMGPCSKKLKAIRTHVPEHSYYLMEKHFNKRFPVTADDFSQILRYKLLSSRNEDLTKYLDVSPELDHRIKRNLSESMSFSELTDALKCKQYTRTRISRALLHIMLDIKNEDLESYRSEQWIPYARVLGFRQSAGPLLNKIKRTTKIPLLTKTADAKKKLTPVGNALLEKEIFSSDLYQSVQFQKYKIPLKNEYSNGIIIEK